MVEATTENRGVRRTYNQFVKPHEISNKFKSKADFKKYFKDCRKWPSRFRMLGVRRSKAE